MRWLAMGIAALLALAGCGANERDAQPSDTRVVRGGGLTAALPRGWHSTLRAFNDISSPPPRLVVTSFSPRRPWYGDGCGLEPLHDQLPADGAFLYLFEYEGPTARRLGDTPPRPAHFRLDPKTLNPYECMGVGYMIRFRDHRRAFQVHVTLGSRASARTRAQIVRVLDSLQVDPPGARDAAVWVPQNRVFDQQPYMGVACPRPNHFACDRVGLAVWLRRPAVAVTAQIGERALTLARQRGQMFVGYLRPAGLLDGPMRLHADDGPGRWIGRRPVEAGVEVLIERPSGRFVRTSLVVPLHAGWG